MVKHMNSPTKEMEKSMPGTSGGRKVVDFSISSILF
jgi:hypothetical protein